MKALTIKQPWAYLIVAGYKDIENRSSRISYRGEILIHAGKSDDKEGFEFADRLGISIPSDLPKGGIVGKANLTDCVQSSPSPWFLGRWGWVLENPEPLEFIPCKGQLGLWDYQGDVLSPLILEQSEISLAEPLQHDLFGGFSKVAPTAKGKNHEKPTSLWIPGLFA